MDNEKRNCFYGVRVGDTVEYGTPGFPETYKTYEVVAYGFMDNNRVILQDKDGKRIKAVAEWCKIKVKVEDKQ